MNRQVTDSVDSPRRRRLLLGVGGTLAATSTGIGQVAGQDGGVTISMNNVGASAWEVTDVQGAESVTPMREENPTLSLQVGTRYTVQNGGWSFHPLAFRDENDDALLSQSGTGRFEDDSAVDWTDDGDTLAFTLTESLAAELDDYTCTVHSSMQATVETVEQAEPAAAVTFGDQTTDGTSVTVDSVRVDDGGFVAIHDDTLLDGEAVGSVVGASEYLEPGSSMAVPVDLDEDLSEDQTLIAMPHRDGNGNESYDFVTSGGSADGPYTDSEGAITDSATLTVEQAEPAAAVTFGDQTTDGTSVTVDSVRVDDGGFVAIHDDTLLDGEAVGSVIGASEYLEPGSSMAVPVDLDEDLSEDQTLIAMPHRDGNGNESYDFVTSGGSADGPYTDSEGAITDSATLTVEQAEPAAAVTFSDQTTDGTSVTIESVRMDDGGFVAIHDDTLLDGEAVGSVIGASEYLEPGSSMAVPVDLDEDLSEDQTLIAMPHRDGNGNESYDFVTSGGSADGPYTDSEGAITDAAEITVEQAEPAAAVTFSDQTTDGTSVTIESVRMDDGGFVAIHDDTLLDGEAVGSVIGASEYLEPGSSMAVPVDLDEDLSEDQTLIAMPHRDGNGNESYDFVTSGGSADGPYTDSEGAITDAAEITVEQAEPAAAVTFSDQTTDGTSVTVDSVRVDDGGFVAIHDDTLLDGEAVGSVVGASEYLEPGSSENVSVDLDEDLSEDQTLIAMPHRDGNGNESYDFVTSGGSADGPYTDSEGAITDSATLTVDTGDEVDGGANESETDNESDNESGDGSGPGFGPVAGLAGLGGLAGYAYRKLRADTEPAVPEDDALDEEDA